MKNLILSLTIIILVLMSCQDVKDTDVDFNPTEFQDPPQWSKEVVWYQIFVERFRNGDRSNDPTPMDMEGTYPGFVPEDWAITPWTQDWYKSDDYFLTAEKGQDFYGNQVTSFGQKSQLRRYGGDLQGVLDMMDYIDSLGVTAIYFNPINDAPSLHKYDARYWRHVDRNFGPDPRGDVTLMESETHTDPSTWKWTQADKLFLEVVEEFHKRGIRVIMDYSWNHTGHTFWAWQDLKKNQENSEYSDWYWVESFDNPATEQNEFKYRGWFGVHDLPEIKETVFINHDEGIKPVEGDIFSEAVKQHIFSITERWLDPNGDGDPSDGVDGFRLDVAAEVPFGFWRDYRKVVRNINPDAYIVGEVWWEKWPGKLLDPEPFVSGDIFDAQMNYRWYRAARAYFNASPPISTSAFIDSLNDYRSNLRDQSVYAMMNMSASHDAPRLSTSLFNKNNYKVGTNPSEENPYKIHKPDAETFQTMKLLLAHQFTYIGAPQIWSGDEMGMWGSDDPNCRKPLIWPDMEFEPEAASLFGHGRPIDEVRFDKELFGFYRSLIQLRKNNKVLSTGDIEFVQMDEAPDVLIYKRFNESSEAWGIFNTNESTMTISLPANVGLKDVLGNAKCTNADGVLSIKILGRSPAILLSH